MSTSTEQVIQILGPTTSGKTEIAIQLAKTLNGALVNSDKLYLYDGRLFCFGTGASDAAENVPRYLFGILGAHAPRPHPDAFAKMLTGAVKTIKQRNMVPIIEGCSVSYNSALIQRHIPSVVIGIRLNDDELAARVKKRVDEIFSQAILETQQLMQSNLVETYVFSRGVIYQIISKFLSGELSEQQTKSMLSERLVSIARDQQERFEGFSNIKWVYNTGNTKNVLSEVIKIIES